MKKILYLFIVLWTSFLVALSTAPTQADDWHFDDDNPVKVLETVKKNANAYKSEEVQKTQLDNTTSKYCTDIGVDDRFTFTRTLCYIKNNVWS